MPNKDKYYMEKYGITEAERNMKIEVQDGRCWICNKKQKVLCCDHRHVKGYAKLPPEEKKKELRGMVCFRCNRYLLGPAERYFKNPREALKNALIYWRAYKCKGDE